MHGSKGIAAGFVAGLVVAGGAVLLLRDDATVTKTPETAQVAELSAQVKRLDESVTRLSALMASKSSAAVHEPKPTEQAASTVVAKRSPEQQRALEEATNLVDQALQSGRWTRAQGTALMATSTGLSADERAALMARVMAAVNRNELTVELH